AVPRRRALPPPAPRRARRPSAPRAAGRRRTDSRRWTRTSRAGGTRGHAVRPGAAIASSAPRERGDEPRELLHARSGDDLVGGQIDTECVVDAPLELRREDRVEALPG